MPIVLAGVAATTWGVADFLGGTAARRAPSAIVAMLAQMAGIVALALVVGLMPGQVLPSALGWGLAAGLAGGVGVPLMYRGLAEGPMNVVAPLTALTSAAVPVLVGALLGERPAPLVWFGIALAVVAGVLVGITVGPAHPVGGGAEVGDAGPNAMTSAGRELGAGAVTSAGRELGAGAVTSAGWDVDAGAGSESAGGARAAKGVLLALFAGLCFGGFFVLLAQAPPAAALWPVLAAKVSGSLVAGVAVLAALRSGGLLAAPDRTPPPAAGDTSAAAPSVAVAGDTTVPADPARSTLLAGRGWRLAVVSGTLDALANAVYLLAAHRGALVVVGAVVALYPASTVLLARWLDGERLGPVQRVGLALAVPALLLVSVG